MTLTIELSPLEQERLTAAARQEGLAPEELVRKVLTDHLPVLAEEPIVEDPTLVLFQQWEREGMARTPEEAADENELWERFQANVNETRAALGMRTL